MNSMQGLDRFAECAFDKNQLVHIIGGASFLVSLIVEDAEGF